MTRLYARICETTPGGRWKIMIILGAMSLREIIASMTIEEATDACEPFTKGTHAWDWPGLHF
jgi:hypothetical protein